MHHAAARPAQRTQIAGNGRHGEVVEHPQGGRAGLAASETIELAGWAGALAAGIALGQIGAHGRALKQHRAARVDRLQSIALPKPDGVLVDAKAGHQFRHAIAAVQLDPLRIGAVRCHRPPSPARPPAAESNPP